MSPWSLGEFDAVFLDVAVFVDASLTEYSRQWAAGRSDNGSRALCWRLGSNAPGAGGEVP